MTKNGDISDPKKFGHVPPDVVEYADSDTEEELREKTFCDKFVNYLFCRGDLANQKLSLEPVSLTGLFRYATRFDMVLFGIGMIGAMLSGLGQPCLAILSGKLFTIILQYEPHSDEFRFKAYDIVYIYLGLGIFIFIINFMQYMCFQHVCCRIVAKIRHNYLKSLIRQNAGWFDKNHSGTLVTQLNDNIERVCEGIGDKLGLLVRGCAMFIGALIVGFIFEWRLSLFMLGLAPLICACMSLMARKLSEATQAELGDVGKAGAIAEEAVLGVRTVQAFNGEEEMTERYEHELRKGRNHGIRKNIWGGFFGGLFYLILMSFLGCGFLLGGYLLKERFIKEPGTIFTVVMALMLGAYFLGQISPHLMVLLGARVAAAVIYKTIDRKPIIDVYSSSGKKPQNITGRVEFRNVHFRYPTRKNVKVLNGMSLTIEPGQTVALVGHSGCGKSTSVGLLTRLYEAEGGEVTIDGYNVKDLNIEWLRHITGIVQQEPILFNDTIEENLRIGHHNLTREEMIRVCIMANAHEFIMKLPKGYETQIGDGGVQLSGGQKQRIAIARTLARNPKILLLDEATSALDAQSESIVQSALDNAAEGRSTIVIAHRLSTIRNAHKIAVFDKGVVVEQGTHEELIKLGGRYAGLVKAQQFQPESEEQSNEDEKVGLVFHGQQNDEPMCETLSASRKNSLAPMDLPGKVAFQRATLAYESMTSRKYSEQTFMMGDQSCPQPEGDAFAQEVESQMKKDSKIKGGFMTMYRNSNDNYGKLVFAFITAIIRGLELPAVALSFGQVFVAISHYDTDPGLMMHQLVIALIMYVCIGALTFLFQFASHVLFGYVSENVILNLRLRSFRNILYQDAAYFDNPAHAPGKLITRLASDAPNAKVCLDSRMMTVTMHSTAWSVCVIVALVCAWPVGLLGGIMGGGLGIFQIITAKIIQTKNLNIMRKNNAGKFAIEIIENVRTIQLLTREKYFFSKYETASKHQKRHEMNKGIYEGVNFAVTQTFTYFALAATYAIGIHCIYLLYVDSANVYRAIGAILLSTVAVMQGSAFFPEFVKARSAIGYLFNIIHRKPATGRVETGEKPKLRGNILFDDVHFVYPQRPLQPIYRGVHFSANRGQTVALVGPSGSGKSTVISLLERFYDARAGAVRFDGNDVKKMSLRHLRSQMALVGQEPRLFAGTIRENILLGMGKQVSDDIIHQALEKANATQFMSRLPHGLDTEVGERGTQLSGGQKQRIAIARALVRDPVILLLDEATSALDSESERAVQEALDRAREGRTCITIAHRLSSIQNADVIVYVENGKVRESGNHSSLMARKGKYYELIKKQDLAV